TTWPDCSGISPLRGRGRSGALVRWSVGLAAEHDLVPARDRSPAAALALRRGRGLLLGGGLRGRGLGLRLGGGLLLLRGRLGLGLTVRLVREWLGRGGDVGV